MLGTAKQCANALWPSWHHAATFISFGYPPKSNSYMYHAQANPAERKNRDLKPRFAIFVENDNTSNEEKLPTSLFALHTAKCENIRGTPTFFQFGRELRTTDDDQHMTFVPSFTVISRTQNRTIPSEICKHDQRN